VTSKGSRPICSRLRADGKNAASLKQIRAALSFACKHWDLKNPFAKIEPPLQKEPQIRYLLLSDIRRLLDYLKVRQQGYGSALAFHLANVLFQTACRFDELTRLSWSDCQRVGEKSSLSGSRAREASSRMCPFPDA
jgi:integrase